MKRFPFFATLVFCLWACQKDQKDCPPDLPCATQTGENTFGCYINGKPWVAGIGPYIFDPTLHAIEAEYDEPAYGNDYQNQLRITVSKWDATSSGFMSLYAWPVRNVGEYEGTFSTSGNIKDINIASQIIAFDLDTLMDYHFEITRLDVDKNIISGKFSLKGISSLDTIRITDGRFDVKYSPY